MTREEFIASASSLGYALIELCISIAEGLPWLGWQCAKGKVLYVNLELDRASCLHRFKDVYDAMQLRPLSLTNIEIWNLRGKSMSMDKLAPKLIRRAVKRQYIAVIIDPIYKIITGDENSAEQMANFCNQFDKVCTDLGCAVIYCHHHSKGLQGAKRSMDRASGSGVFARDPDALLDLIELDVTEAVAKQEQNKAICRTCEKFLDAHRPDWREYIGQDDTCSAMRMREGCENLLSAGEMAALDESVESTVRALKQRTAWRLEGTLREYPKFEPRNLWFDFPIHTVDTGSLSDVNSSGAPARRRSAGRPKPSKEEQLATAYEACSFNGEVTVKALAEYWGITERAVRIRIKDSDGFKLQLGAKGTVKKTTENSDEE